MDRRDSTAGTGGIPSASAHIRAVGGWRLLFALAAIPSVLLARRIDIRDMPVSPYADTEVSTNVVLCPPDTDIRELSVHIRLDGAPTNALELAFGCDVNANGILDVEEIDVVYGWRGGRYFIENVREWNRMETEVVTNAPVCVFDIHLKNDKAMEPVLFTAVCGGSPAFAGLAATPPPPWLYRRQWNRLRIVRRGAGVSGDWIHCETDNNAFILKVK